MQKGPRIQSRVKYLSTGDDLSIWFCRSCGSVNEMIIVEERNDLVVKTEESLRDLLFSLVTTLTEDPTLSDSKEFILSSCGWTLKSFSRNEDYDSSVKTLEAHSDHSVWFNSFFFSSSSFQALPIFQKL